MNPYLRDKLLQKLETMADERGYQVLDYVEFLESKYAERQTPTAAAAANPLSRFADAVEEKYPDLVGGLGLYTSPRFRTPYVHIDARGKRSRWQG